MSEHYGIVCNECRSVVAHEAERCPNCGASFVAEEKPRAPVPLAVATAAPPAPPIAATRELAAYYTANRDHAHWVFAGFWIRTLAYLIDGLLLFAASFPLYAAVGRWSGLLGLGAWLYFAIMESSPWQGTVGKRMLGLRVIGKDGERISFGRAVARYFSKILSALPLGLGFYMVGWTVGKRGLHDMIASTYVTRH